MEASKEENWWLGDYPNYSLKRYRDMPIYQRFSSSSRPFTRLVKEYREAFWRDDNCYIFEWFDSKDQKGEKFGLDHNSTTYFYEHWFIEEDIHIVEKSWLCGDIEWGVIIKYHPEYEEEITWSTESDKKVVETRTKLPERLESKKKGQKLTPEGLEDFTEIFWETPTSSGKEKAWTRGTAKGEEKEYKDGDQKWGESWVTDVNLNKKKEWHEEGNHKWGKEEGEEGYQKWDEKWDRNSQGSMEEVEFNDRGQAYGKLRVRAKSSEYKLEWNGEKPSVGLGEKGEEDKEDGKKLGLKKPQQKKLRSSRPPAKAERKEDDEEAKGEAAAAPQVSELEKLGVQLGNLFADLKRDMENKISDLSDVDPNRLISADLQNVNTELAQINPPEALNPQEAIAKIQSLKDLDRQISSAEQRLISSQPTRDQLRSLFNESCAVAASLLPVLDPTNISETPEELQALSKEFESSASPKDQLRLLSAINPKIRDMLRASSKAVEDSAREIAELSQKLASHLKAFEEPLRHSQQTLIEIERNFKPNEETVQPILNAYVERARDLIQAIESSAPYNQTLPQIALLLVDMEKFKRELMDNELNERLNDIKNDLDNANRELMESLHGPEAEVSEETPSSLKGGVGILKKKSGVLRSLAEKANGKDIPTGDPEIDSIKPKNEEANKIPFDAVELLKEFWVQGKLEQDAAFKALQGLAEAIGTEDEKAQVAESNESCQKLVSGIVPDSNPAALEQLQQCLGSYLPLKLSQADLLGSLLEKAQQQLKESRISPETNVNLWKALYLSEKIADKLTHGDPPTALEELKKSVEAFPDHPKLEELLNAVQKYQEINLSLINLEDEMTAEEIKEAENAAKKRAGGRLKGKALEKRGKKVLRSGRGGPKKADFTEPSLELLESSFKTVNELVLWSMGARPNTLRKIEELKTEKDTISALVKENCETEEARDKFLEYLKKLEDAKQGVYANADITKNLMIILQKCEKVVETTEKIVNTPVPAEVEELKKRKPADSLSESSKRIGFLLSIFFKMVKDATGVDEGGENLEDALSALKKKQAISMLPFDPQQLLGELKAKSNGDVKRLKFLAGLVGTDEEIKNNEDLEARAELVLQEINPQSPQEAMELIDTYLHGYPEIEREISARTEVLLSELVNRLCNPEPLERDVHHLIEALEKLDVAVSRLEESKSASPKFSGLKLRLAKLPTSPKELMPYLTELTRDYSAANLELLSITIGKPLTKEEEAKIASITARKVKAAPVQIIRDVQHLFSGPDTQDMISLILRLNKVIESFMSSFTIGDPALYVQCQDSIKKLEILTPVEVKHLGKTCCDVLLSFDNVTHDLDELMAHIEEEESALFSRRQDRRIQSTLAWEDIFKSRGLDIDAALICEAITEEQESAMIYITEIPAIFGLADHKAQAAYLGQRSSEILKEVDEKSKIENYIQVRLEESKFISGLCNRLKIVNERLVLLDKDRENNLSLGIQEVTQLVEKNNPELRSQLEIIVNKEEELKRKEVENVIDTVMRGMGRLGLEKELQRLKDEAKPSENSEEELIKSLAELESKLYSELRAINAFLNGLSQELGSPEENLKHLTEPQVSTTVPALLISLNIGLSSHNQFLASLTKSIASSALKPSIASLLKQLEAEASKDDSETELVFSGLFRLCGSSEDKAKAKKLREQRLAATEEKSYLSENSANLEAQLRKYLPMRVEQSKLQNKLMKDAGKMRDGVDDVDLMTEDILAKASREAANSILPDDTKSREALDGIRKTMEAINEKSPTNIPECVDRVIKRLEAWEKLERLRKDLREKSSKEINRLRGEVQDKLNDLATAKATNEGQKTQFEAQIVLLQSTADLNASLVGKLTQEAAEKESAISALKNSLAELKNLSEEQKEDLEKLQDEVNSNSKELRNLRRINKEKETQIRDLTNELETHERTSEKSSLGDREKSEILDKLKADNRQLREELMEKGKLSDELAENLALVERNCKKLEIEKGETEKDLEKVRSEKQHLKADLMKTATEKSELEEKLKLNDGQNPDEVRHLERILEEKQKELEEAEASLIVARRYQQLYPDLVIEKQDLENKFRESLIDLEELKRKFDESKSDNDKLKFKLASLDNLSKEAVDLQKENQKFKMRLNFLEQSSGVNKDTSDLAKQLSDDISNKDSQIKDLLDEIERLKEEINRKVIKYNVALSRSFLVRLCHVFKEMQGESFRKWRVFKIEANTPSDFPLLPYKLAIEPSAEEKPFEKSYVAADEVLSAHNKSLLDANVLLESYKPLNHSSEKPMSYINVFKFLEELMDKKFEADSQGALDQKPIVEMPQFMMDTLLKTFGIQSLALKFLSQFMPGFYQIVKDGHQYGIFFARVMNLFHPDPVPLSLAVYLVKARMDFHPLIEKYDRLQAETNKENKKKVDMYGRNSFESAGTGGLALVGDAIELVYSLFKSEKECGEKVLELIRPEKVTIEDFVAFKICHKMAKLGKTPEMIFTMLDKDQGGTIDVEEFISGTKEDLDLWISDENVTKLLKLLDTNGNNEISKESFMGKINMKFLIDCNKSPTWVVSKARYLIALLEVFKFKERKTLAHLHPRCEERPDGYGKEEFIGLMCEFDPNLSKENAEKLFAEAKNRQKGTVEFNGLSGVFSKYGFGEMKPFKNREFIQELTRRKLLISEEETISVNVTKSFTTLIVGNTRIDRDEEEKVIIKKKVVKKLVKKSN